MVGAGVVFGCEELTNKRQVTIAHIWPAARDPQQTPQQHTEGTCDCFDRFS